MQQRGEEYTTHVYDYRTPDVCSAVVIQFVVYICPIWPAQLAIQCMCRLKKAFLCGLNLKFCFECSLIFVPTYFFMYLYRSDNRHSSVSG